MLNDIGITPEIMVRALAIMMIKNDMLVHAPLLLQITVPFKRKADFLWCLNYILIAPVLWPG